MELMIINVSCIVYLMIAGYQFYKYKDTMHDGAIHHLRTHTYVVAFFLIAANLYVSQGMKVPLMFVFFYVVQHVVKENIRLTKTNKWTDSVPEGE